MVGKAHLRIGYALFGAYFPIESSGPIVKCVDLFNRSRRTLMKAVVIHRFGGPEVLELAELEVPEPLSGQVRIKVQAAAVNPVDIATRAGSLADHGLMHANGRIGIGWDLAGVVDELGPDVDRFRVGDPVIAMRDLLTASIGAQAEYVVLDTEAVAPAPSNASPVEAATIPLNGLTASQALDLLALAEGQSVLVTGAAGALGGFAVQLAALRGLRIVAVASPDDESLVHGLGADAFVARTDNLGTPVRRVVPSGVDGALDAASVGISALDSVRDGGTFVAVAAGAAPMPLRGTHVHNVWIRTDASRLAQLSGLVDEGLLTPRVAAAQPLETVAAAHERLSAGGLRGRIVLQANRGAKLLTAREARDQATGQRISSSARRARTGGSPLSSSAEVRPAPGAARPIAASVVTSQYSGTANSAAMPSRSNARNWRTCRPRACAWIDMCATA
jgi:NADPH:quinone reductase